MKTSILLENEKVPYLMAEWFGSIFRPLKRRKSSSIGCMYESDEEMGETLYTIYVWLNIPFNQGSNFFVQPTCEKQKAF